MLYYISSFNRVIMNNGNEVYQNAYTKLFIPYSESTEFKITKILNQQLSKLETSQSGIILQLLAAELLYMGIIVPVEHKEREAEYLDSIILFKQDDNTFFNLKSLTEYQLFSPSFNMKDVIFCGIPSDIGSDRPGTRFGPYILRSGSRGMVSGMNGSVCCLDLQKLNNIFSNKNIYDVGNINLPLNEASKYLEKVEYVSHLISKKGRPFFIGGDHLFTLPILKGIYSNRKNKNFTIVQLDSHLDIQVWGDFDNGYPKKLAVPDHSNFISWVKHCMPEISILQIGINNYQGISRSNLDNVTHYLDSIGQRITNIEIFNNTQEYLKNKLPKNQDIYLTIDVDVINSVYMPSTGYPGAVGINLEMIFFIIKTICLYNNIIGVDIMEFAQSINREFHSRMSNIINSLILEILKGIYK